MDFDSEVGRAVLELIKYWKDIGEDPKYRLPMVLRGRPLFAKTTRMEKKILSMIKDNVTAEKWNELGNLFNEAEEYISDKDKRRGEEYNSVLQQKKLAEARTKRIEAERMIKAAMEEEQIRIQKQKEKDLKRIRKQKEEDQRRIKEQQVEEQKRKQTQLKLEEKNGKYNELENIFNNNFLGSRQDWQNKLSTWISEDEFIELSVRFITNWFEKQGWSIPDQEQALCIAEVWDDLQVVARAGSGKTSTAVNRAAFLVKHCGVSPSEILLLAFNRKAAKEVNDRLYELLGEATPQAMTFHALAYALVHPEEALIYDDETIGLMKSSTVQEVIDSFIRKTSWSNRIQDLMIKYFRASWEDFISGGYHLSPEEMVEYRRNLPYIGLDGMYYKSKGEKKLADYLFEHDVPYKYEKNFVWKGINYKPDFTIPLYNTNLKGVVIEYFGLTGDALYDMQTRDKRIFWNNKSDYDFIELLPGQVDSMELLDQSVGTYLKKCGFKMRRLKDSEIWHRIKDRAVDEFSSTVSQFIGRCRMGMISPEELIALIKNKKSLSELQIDFSRVAIKIYQEYLQILSIKCEEDFEGLLIRAEEVVRTGKSNWKRKAGSGDLKVIKYLFIDEYQDFSLLFYRLISAIKNINRDMRVFCVGDDWQAINGFAGSDLCYFMDFQGYFEEAKTLMISSNYRSSRKIVEVGNLLMQGLGAPSKSVLTNFGDVQVAWIDDFKPNIIEEGIYSGDVITPMLIRLVYSYVLKGQRVALLCRRKNGLPWYTPHDSRKGMFHDKFIATIRDAFPEELRPMVVAMDTTHSYKGKEEDAIIVVDAVMRSYPLLHPRNVFFEVLGQTLDVVISEEKRLFYVALSRAKKSLVIVTERNEESPFLTKLLRSRNDLKVVELNKLQCPERKGTHYIVSIGNNYNQKNGTYEIKSDLQENKYHWNSERRAWIKHFSGQEFSKEKLLKESWAKKAINVLISVTDEFNQEILQIDIIDGVVTSREFEKGKDTFLIGTSGHG